MVSNVAHFLLELPDEQFDQVAIEDVAVALAWFNSLDPESEERQNAAALPEFIERWLAAPEPEDLGLETEGRRQQPLLRALISAAGEAPDDLNPSEWSVLAHARELAQRANRDLSRLVELFDPLLATDAAREAPTPEPGLPDGDHRVRFIRGADIRRTRPRKVRYFAGVDMPAFGPVLSIPGDVKVLDNVPDESMLVVEDGHCTIGSYVLGRVAARYSCEVRNNISGVVVVREGAVRARSAIGGAFVVSKWGDVHLRGSHNPRLIFAGSSIAVAETAQYGTYAAPQIDVAGEAVGGSWSVSRHFRAVRFRQTDNQKMDIALRPEITYEDYGGLIAPEATKLLHRLARIRRTESGYGNMMRLARDECEQLASSAVLFMLSGDKIRQDIDKINAARRRITFLDRVIAGIDAATSSTEERLQHGDGDGNAGEASGFESLEEELGEIEAEGSVGEDLAEEGRRIVLYAKRTKTTGRRPVTATDLFELREKKVNWLMERETLYREVEELENALNEAAGRNELLNNDTGDSSRVQLLSKILTLARKRPPGDPLHERAKGRFISMILRSIDARRRRLKKYAKLLEESRSEKESLAKTLETEHHIRPRIEGRAPEPPRVCGRFEAGITLCTDRYLLEESDVPEGQVLQTPDSGDRSVCYVRRDDRIVEET